MADLVTRRKADRRCRGPWDSAAPDPGGRILTLAIPDTGGADDRNCHLFCSHRQDALRSTLAASRDNELLARGLGKNTRREKLTLFVITCALMGLVGVLSAPVHRFLTPDLIGPGVTFSAWIALIVGGKRHPLGGVLGVALTIFVFDFVIETYVPVPSEHAATVTVIKTIVYGVTLIAVLHCQPVGLIVPSVKRRQ